MAGNARVAYNAFVLVINVICFLIAVIAMEGVAWATHRWVMHGPLWVLHKSHHSERTGAFEANDLFAVGFAGIAIAMFWIGAEREWSAITWAAAGVTTYGALYAIVHDGMVHRRWPFRVVPRRGYLKGLVQAHRLHHAVDAREGAVSFGFLAPQDVRRLSASLKRRREGSDMGPQVRPVGNGQEPLDAAPQGDQRTAPRQPELHAAGDHHSPL